MEDQIIPRKKWPLWSASTPACKQIRRFWNVNLFLANPDGFRHAVEYVRRGKNGRRLTGDIIVVGPLYGVSTWNVISPSTAEAAAELNFLEEAIPDLNSNCHLKAADDYFLPGPRPRADWRRLTLKDLDKAAH